jgi:alpha-aminoadipate carrier protein LysW
MNKSVKTRARCPECEAWVTISDKANLGDLVTCRECETQLEIVGFDPVELDYADWGDEDDYDDDDEDF